MKELHRVLVLCETSSTHGRDIVEGINHFALEHDWNINFEQRGRFDTTAKRFTPWNADGIISRTYHKSMHRILLESKLPLVELFGSPYTGIDNEVAIDEASLAVMIVDHFLERGLRRFAYYCMEDAPFFHERRRCLLNYLEKKGYGCEICPTSWRDSDYFFPQWHEKYRKQVTKWLRELPKPIALYAAIDNHAQIILNICREEKIQIPQDISVVSVGNDEWLCRLYRPTISSVDASGYTIGYTAAQLLQAKMEKRPVPKQKINIPCSFLAVRQSSDFYSIGDPDTEKALLYIRENACSRLTVSEVADHLNLSERSLYRGFKKFLNRTPQSEILRIQMETAKQFLRETTLPIVSIAHRTGFSTPEYFVRAFRRECKVTPNVYRQRCRFQSADDSSSDVAHEE
ncbi:MAG: DNA-binding transcriptional regulator [Planctomycetia bacterium]|nr:DNA-binding transcriptional regulator [Planctomycetia bacterium]